MEDSAERRGAAAPLSGTQREAIRIVRKSVGDATDGTPEVRGMEPSAEVWPDPVPFDDPNLPEFPDHVLPERFGAWAGALSTSRQTPIDLAVWNGLAAISHSIQNKFVVRPRSDWREPVNTYTYVVGESGERKTSIVVAARRPLVGYEAASAEAMKVPIREVAGRKRRLEARLQEIERKLAKASREDSSELEREAIAVEVEIANVDIPVVPSLLTYDVTPEALGVKMAEQSNRATIMTDEDSLFAAIAARYSNPLTANVQLVLHAHNAGSYRVERIGRAKDVLEHPALTICITAQSGALREAGRVKHFRNCGLMARFLYSYPKSTLGRRDVDPPPMPDELNRWYDAMLQSLLNLPVSRDEQGVIKPVEIELSSDAQRKLREFMLELEPMMGSESKLVHMRDWLGKLAGQALRVSAQLRFSEWDGSGDPPSELGGEDVERGIGLAKLYLVAHAKACLAEMGATESTANAKRVWPYILKAADGEPSVDNTRIWRALGGRPMSKEDLNDALDELEARAFIREKIVERSDGRKSGRPRRRFLLNPKATSLGQ